MIEPHHSFYLLFLVNLKNLPLSQTTKPKTGLSTSDLYFKEDKSIDWRTKCQEVHLKN